MRLKEVTTAKGGQEFIEVALQFYQDDPNWIRPLDRDIGKVFNRQKNPAWKHGGNARRWIAYDDKGRVIGRIAAFVNPKYSEQQEQPTGGLGFFECVDDQEVANGLFNVAKHWLQEEGMEAMDGPINFGEKNMWWGVLAKGYTEPVYGMNYSKPYYPKLFEGYGFQLYYKQFSYYLAVEDPRPAGYQEKARDLLADPDFSFEHIRKDNLKKYAEDFRTVYNKAWAGGHEGFKEMTEGEALVVMLKMKPILVEDVAWFGYYKGEPIAAFIMLPDVNQYLKHLKGKLDFEGKLKFLWLKLRKKVAKLQGLIFGIVPEHQGKGVEAALITAARNHIVPQKRWKDVELSWIGDFNPKMHKIADKLGAGVNKVHHTYRYLFDRSKPFKRHPIVNL